MTAPTQEPAQRSADQSSPAPAAGAGPDEAGRFGDFGGRFMPEALMAALDELTVAWQDAMADDAFTGEFRRMLTEYAGVPSSLYDATKLSELAGARILLKREDLNHTGAHKIRNVLGQALLTKRMGKTRMIAETGAGQHGVATATAAAYLGLECTIYMGEVDTQRQALNVARMQLLGAEVIPVTSGSRTLKDAINEAIRDWVASVDRTAYCFGTAAGPHPFPAMVRDFCRGIGDEAREQCLALTGALPDAVAACVGGGSNAIGIFTAFLEDEGVQLLGLEPGGDGVDTHRHAATIWAGQVGVLHGARTYVLQDEDGQTVESHSISAGLDYPGVGPQHAHLAQTGRATYRPVTDTEAMDAMALLSRTEGIIPAIESAHAIAGAMAAGQGAPRVHDPGQPLRPRRQGHGHRHRVVRPRPDRPRRHARSRPPRNRSPREPSDPRQPHRRRLREDARRGPGRARGLPAGRLPRRRRQHRGDQGDGRVGLRRHRGGAALQRPRDGRAHDPGGRPAGARARRPHHRRDPCGRGRGRDRHPHRRDDLLEPRRAVRRSSAPAPTA